ncbi:MAG: hypothetical protein P8174_04960 [Gemmatimonadota bacterium]
MRRKLPVILGTAFLAFVVACEGPAGPQGPAGADGTNGATGATGPQGEPGVSPVVNCQECHNSSTELLSRMIQYEHSVHYTGGNLARANDPVCAVCHSDEGFVERITNGTDTIAAGITNPTPPNCRTCHMIHTNYDSTDLRLRTTSPVTLLVNDSTVSGPGASNLCIQCHQPRPAEPMPVLGGDSVHITSAYWGPHHGPQGAVLEGTGAFVFAGSSVTTGPSTHGDTLFNGGCPTCHMATPYGDQAGGHTWNMTYTLHGTVEDNTAGCLAFGCHSIMPDFDKAGVQTNVQGLLDSLEVLLQGKGILDSTGTVVAGGTFTSDLTAAYLNWTFFEQDRSLGVHNPPYVQAVLANTIDAVNAMP